MMILMIAMQKILHTNLKIADIFCLMLQELRSFMEKYQPHPVDILQARHDYHDNDDGEYDDDDYDDDDDDPIPGRAC